MAVMSERRPVIVEYLKRYPSMMPVELAALIRRERSMTVDKQHISNVKSELQRQGTLPRPELARALAAAQPATAVPVPADRPKTTAAGTPGRPQMKKQVIIGYLLRYPDMGPAALGRMITAQEGMQTDTVEVAKYRREMNRNGKPQGAWMPPPLRMGEGEEEQEEGQERSGQDQPGGAMSATLSGEAGGVVGGPNGAHGVAEVTQGGVPVEGAPLAGVLERAGTEAAEAALAQVLPRPRETAGNGAVAVLYRSEGAAAATPPPMKVEDRVEAPPAPAAAPAAVSVADRIEALLAAVHDVGGWGEALRVRKLLGR